MEIWKYKLNFKCNLRLRSRLRFILILLVYILSRVSSWEAKNRSHDKCIHHSTFQWRLFCSSFLPQRNMCTPGISMVLLLQLLGCTYYQEKLQATWMTIACHLWCKCFSMVSGGRDPSILASTLVPCGGCQWYEFHILFP